jgi:hypothetical protein
MKPASPLDGRPLNILVDPIQFEPPTSAFVVGDTAPFGQAAIGPIPATEIRFHVNNNQEHKGI